MREKESSRPTAFEFLRIGATGERRREREAARNGNKKRRARRRNEKNAADRLVEGATNEREGKGDSSLSLSLSARRSLGALRSLSRPRRRGVLLSASLPLPLFPLRLNLSVLLPLVPSPAAHSLSLSFSRRSARASREPGQSLPALSPLSAGPGGTRARLSRLFRVRIFPRSNGESFSDALGDAPGRRGSLARRRRRATRRPRLLLLSFI